jgi:hypothetical protein
MRVVFSRGWRDHPGHHQSEVSSEGMNQNTATNIYHIFLLGYHSLIQRIYQTFESCHGEELEGTDFSEHTTEADEHSSGTELSVDHEVDVDLDSLPGTFEDTFPKTAEENVKLHREDCSHVIQADRGPGVRFQKDHQKPESYEDHDVDMLEEVVKSGKILFFIVGLSMERCTVTVCGAGPKKDYKKDLNR